MSPIIYTPHDCEKPKGDLPKGTLWQCDICDKVWELEYIRSRDTHTRTRAWSLVKDPRRTNALLDAINKAGDTRG